MSKRKNYQKDRRRVRRMEKNADVPRDVTLGRACRRLWGAGMAAGYPAKSKDRKKSLALCHRE